MKNEIEQQIFEKMKAKDFGESMCNETKLNVLKWTMQQLRKHDVSWRIELLLSFGEFMSKQPFMISKRRMPEYIEEFLKANNSR